MSSLRPLQEALMKVGARNSKKDAAAIQTIHDNLAFLADARHCGGKPEEGEEEVSKRGARNSRADLMRIEAAHQLMCDLGASCPGKK